jgi:hypothetical protein
MSVNFDELFKLRIIPEKNWGIFGVVRELEESKNLSSFQIQTKNMKIRSVSAANDFVIY